MFFCYLYLQKIKEMFQLDLTPEELSRPPIQKWINIISDAGENSVAIHIRRGDYGEDERKDNNWFTPICFYQKSVKTMLAKLDLSKDASFFIFSDQIDLVRQELLRYCVSNVNRSFEIFRVLPFQTWKHSGFCTYLLIKKYMCEIQGKYMYVTLYQVNITLHLKQLI